MVTLMIKRNFISNAKDVINLEIKALQNLKKSLNNSFSQAVIQIAKCQSKVILCGVRGIIAPNCCNNGICWYTVFYIGR